MPCRHRWQFIRIRTQSFAIPRRWYWKSSSEALSINKNICFSSRLIVSRISSEVQPNFSVRFKTTEIIRFIFGRKASGIEASNDPARDGEAKPAHKTAAIIVKKYLFKHTLFFHFFTKSINRIMRSSSVKQPVLPGSVFIRENFFVKCNLFPKKHQMRKNCFYLDFFHKNY